MTWKDQIWQIINGCGLNGYLDGSISAPTPTILTAAGTTEMNPDYHNWYIQDQIMLGWLRCSILELVLGYFIHCQTSAALWASLHQVYDNMSHVHMLELQEQLQTLQCGSGSESVSVYIHKPVSDEANDTLCPTDFVSFMLSYADSCYFSQSESLKASHNLDPVALHTSTNESEQGSGQGTYNSGPGPSHPSSSQVHSDDHHTSQPPLLPTPPSEDRGTYSSPRGSFPAETPDQQLSPLICQICSQAGHIALECFYRFDRSYISPTPLSQSLSNAPSLPPSFLDLLLSDSP
jgi:hypothetical protein